MIGNDIIDLNHARKTSNIHHPRWADKVLTEQEKKQIHHFPSLETALWTFWAFKESAYKIFFKKTGRRLFIPKKFQLTLTSLEPNLMESTIHSPLGKWYGQVQLWSDSIHALVTTQDSFFPNIRWQKLPLRQTIAAKQSKAVRQGLLQSLYQQHQVPAEAISISSPRQFPQVFLKNKVLPIDVSMSHHHQWGAFAFLQADH
jgi:phosphopantetheinyl transferase (holo-ACP synthase)